MTLQRHLPQFPSPRTLKASMILGTYWCYTAWAQIPTILGFQPNLGRPHIPVPETILDKHLPAPAPPVSLAVRSTHTLVQGYLLHPPPPPTERLASLMSPATEARARATPTGTDPSTLTPLNLHQLGFRFPGLISSTLHEKLIKCAHEHYPHFRGVATVARRN